jgi:hypothetical protein
MRSGRGFSRYIRAALRRAHEVVVQRVVGMIEIAQHRKPAA